MKTSVFDDHSNGKKLIDQKIKKKIRNPSEEISSFKIFGLNENEGS